MYMAGTADKSTAKRALRELKWRAFRERVVFMEMEILPERVSGFGFCDFADGF